MTSHVHFPSMRYIPARTAIPAWRVVGALLKQFQKGIVLLFLKIYNPIRESYNPTHNVHVSLRSQGSPGLRNFRLETLLAFLFTGVACKRGLILTIKSCHGACNASLITLSTRIVGLRRTWAVKRCSKNGVRTDAHRLLYLVLIIGLQRVDV